MSFDQIVGLALLGLSAVLSVGLMIDNRGGWNLFWAELKRKK